MGRVERKNSIQAPSNLLKKSCDQSQGTFHHIYKATAKSTDFYMKKN
jgi:hypothetical protein